MVVIIIVVIIFMTMMIMIMAIMMIEDYLGSAVSRSWEPRAIVRPPRFHKSTNPSSLGFKMSTMLMITMKAAMMGMILILKMIKRYASFLQVNALTWFNFK